MKIPQELAIIHSKGLSGRMGISRKWSNQSVEWWTRRMRIDIYVTMNVLRPR